MARFCWAWRITPREYEQLSLEEIEAMTLVANEMAAKGG